jgi:hypothetical protein
MYPGPALADVTSFAQAVYLQTHGITNDVTGSDLTSFLNDTVTWANMFASELELKADWKYLRTNNNALGTVAANTTTYTLATNIRKPIYHPQRQLTIQQSGVIVSTWTLVDPDQIQGEGYTSGYQSSPSPYMPGGAYPYNPQYAMVDNGVLTLSRVPYDYEVGGTLVADTMAWMPQLSLTDSTLLQIVTPPKIMVLGVAKDNLPPDLVRGGLATLIETRYNTLLADAIKDNGGSSMDDESMPDDLSFVGGNYLNG